MLKKQAVILLTTKRRIRSITYYPRERINNFRLPSGESKKFQWLFFFLLINDGSLFFFSLLSTDSLCLVGGWGSCDMDPGVFGDHSRWCYSDSICNPLSEGGKPHVISGFELTASSETKDYFKIHYFFTLFKAMVDPKNIMNCHKTLKFNIFLIHWHMKTWEKKHVKWEKPI